MGERRKRKEFERVEEGNRNGLQGMWRRGWWGSGFRRTGNVGTQDQAVGRWEACGVKYGRTEIFFL